MCSFIIDYLYIYTYYGTFDTFLFFSGNTNLNACNNNDTSEIQIMQNDKKDDLWKAWLNLLKRINPYTKCTELFRQSVNNF